MPTEAEILESIRACPGLRCEQIAEGLGCTPAHLSIELRRLRNEGRLRKRGNTRGATWFPPLKRRS